MVETSNAERKKHLYYRSDDASAEDDHNGEEDRISDLPYEIVHHIFSFLPLENVAKTCVLSKRWKYLWYSYPCLDFSTAFDSSFERDCSISGHDSAIQKRSDRINEVLRWVDNRCWDVRILKFRRLRDDSAIVRSMRLAFKHNVQELDLQFFAQDRFDLPRYIVDSLSLRDLRLTSSSPRGLRLPPLDATKSCFKSLQSLYLFGTDFCNHPSHLNLFSDSLFPSLAKLDLEACLRLKHLRIQMSGLKDLCLATFIEELDISAKKLEKLSVTNCFVFDAACTRVAIDAPLLEVITWIDNVTGEFVIGKCDSLKEATVNLQPFDEDLSDSQLRGLSNFLNGISPCRSLTLVSVIEILSRNSYRMAGVQRCAFDRLTSLEVILSHDESESWVWDEDIEWEFQAQSLDFFFHHVKVVKIVGFEECSNHVDLVKLLLNHAKVLEQLLLVEYEHSASGEDTMSEIMESPRASSDAHIIFQMIIDLGSICRTRSLL